ncbi:uncharacterized protein LOC115770141 [Drosophila novamexicana]|uniref:uncharacterized protein LOC115770141 n=1 Tax=Drosophila novamexicana TaxID=47314 RepID=UPI0011E5D201|nr:uncharacterized protein LOC115770141 [Drosophila novamexicana]
MVKTFQLVVVVLLTLTNQLKTSDDYIEGDFRMARTMTRMQKYEYCIKIIMVCFAVIDSPPDYEDETNASPTRVSNAMYEEFKKTRCIPKNLNYAQNKTFWANVRRWQSEVDEQLLSTNIFTIKEEFDNGRAIKINLWNIFKIRKVVICNRTKILDEQTTTRAPSTIETSTALTTTEKPGDQKKSCDEQQEIGIWINEQMQMEDRLANLIKMLPNILSKLDLHINRNCCPYAILRDRLEVINDNVDAIMELKALGVYARAKSTGYALLDVRNLIIRLEYLNQKTVKGNHSGGNCCINWEQEVKGFQSRFQLKKDSIQSYAPNSSIYNPLTESQNSLAQTINRQEHSLLKTEAMYEKGPASRTLKAQCCINNNNNNKNTSNISLPIMGDIQLYDFRNHSSKELQQSNENLSETIQNTQMLINDEQTKADSLISLCTEMRIEKQKADNQSSLINSKLSQLDRDVQQNAKNLNAKAPEIQNSYEIVDSGNKTLDIIRSKLNKALSKQMMANKRRAEEFENFINSMKAFDLSKEHLFSDCLVIVGKLKVVQKLNLDIDSKKDTFKFDTQRADATLKELYDKLGDFAKRLSMHVANIGSESKTPKENEQYKLLSSIGKQIQDLTPIARKHSKTEDDQSQNIITATDKLKAKLDGQPEQVELADSLDAKIKKYVERGINELELKLNASNFSPNGNPAHSPDIFKKLDELEAGFNDLREQRNGKEQDMLNTIADLKSRLKEVNDKIFNAEAAHKKCLVECDFGELPSIEELQARLHTLKIYLRKRKQANKRSP